MKNASWPDRGVFIVDLCFLALYLVLVFNNRLAVDDFHFLERLKEHGLLGGVAVEHEEWSTRWTARFLNLLFLRIHELSGPGLLLHGVLGLGLFVVALYLLLRNSWGFLSACKAELRRRGKAFGSLHSSSLFDPSSKGGRPAVPNWRIWNWSVLLLASIFITTFRIDETWFWLCASCTYLWAMIMLLLGTAWVFSPAKEGMFTGIGCLAFLYVGGANGPLAFFVLLILMASILLLFWKGTSGAAILARLRKRLSLAFLCSAIGFIVLYMGEGNRVREALFDDIGIGEALLLNVKMTGIILLKRLPEILPFILIASMPMLVLGGRSTEGLSRSSLLKKLVFCSILYGLLIFVYQLPITYKTRDVAAFRASLPISVLSLLTSWTIFFLIGAYVQPGAKWRRLLLLFPLSFFALFFLFQLIHQSRVTSDYAEAYDRRMERIEAHRGRSSPLRLEPLPPSGMLYRASIGKDTAHFSNRHMKRGLGLDFPLARE